MVDSEHLMRQFEAADMKSGMMQKKSNRRDRGDQYLWVFIGDAKEESINMILNFVAAKAKKKSKSFM